MSWASRRALEGLDPPGAARRGPHERWDDAAARVMDAGMLLLAVLWLFVLPGSAIADAAGVPATGLYDALLYGTVAAGLLMWAGPILTVVGDSRDRRAVDRDPDLT